MRKSRKWILNQEMHICITCGARRQHSFGVVLMLYSAAGISAISSVPYAFSLVLPRLTLGTWTYIFQGVLILTLMIMRKKFVPQYLCSFIVGFVFGKMLDIHDKYAHDYPSHYGKQQYLPDGLENNVFYEPSDMGYEHNIKEHMLKIQAEADSNEG